MKAPLAILLAACLSVDGAVWETSESLTGFAKKNKTIVGPSPVAGHFLVFSLVCWSCQDVESNWSCWRLQFCSSDDNYCATTYTGAGIGGYSKQSISKGCVPVCPQGGINIGIAAVSVKCCSSSFCNISGASTLKTSPLVLVAGVLTSLLYLCGARL